MTAEAATGSEFGDYDLHELVGSDLVSATYRASRRSVGGRAVGEQVALRLVDPAVAGHRRAVDGFLRANRRAADVDHAHVLRVLDVGERDGQPYVASVWRQGTWLADMLADHAPLPVWVALRLAGQLAEALDAVHAGGQVHGTLGLRTIWVKNRRRDQAASSALLTGFGSGYLLASMLQRGGDPSSLDDVRFVAPEQLRGDTAVGATDQYALACVLYTMLGGAPPFVGDTTRDVFDGHLHGVAASVTAARPDLADGWDDVFARALAKDPHDRYANCRSMVRAGAAFTPSREAQLRDGPPVAWAPRTVSPADRAQFPHATADPADTPSGRRPLRIALLVALLVVVIVVGVVLAVR